MTGRISRAIGARRSAARLDGRSDRSSRRFRLQAEDGSSLLLSLPPSGGRRIFPAPVASAFRRQMDTTLRPNPVASAFRRKVDLPCSCRFRLKATHGYDSPTRSRNFRLQAEGSNAASGEFGGVTSARSRGGYTARACGTVVLYNSKFQPVVFSSSCGSGGTGRRASLRSLWPQGRGGSNPLFRTNLQPDPTGGFPAIDRPRRIVGRAPQVRFSADQDAGVTDVSHGRSSACRRKLQTSDVLPPEGGSYRSSGI
jgi:hypothetical protein